MDVIKNMNVKPMLERAEFERLSTPDKGATVNLRIGDDITVTELNNDVVKVSVARTVASNPEYIFKIFVEMSAEVLINREAYDALSNAKDYFAKSPVARMLSAQIATIIANLTINSAIGPMITVPMIQA